METKYSINEILNAINELQKDKKTEEIKAVSKKIDNFGIPKDTLRLIEEAEKSRD